MTKFHYNNNVPTNVYYNNQVVNKVFYTDANGNNTEVWPLTPSETIDTGTVMMLQNSTSSFTITISFNTDGSITFSSTAGQASLSVTSSNWATGGSSDVGNNYYIGINHSGDATAPPYSIGGTVSSSILYTLQTGNSGAVAGSLSLTIKHNTTNATTSKIIQYLLEVEDGAGGGGFGGGN
jgi:hypothetical protein